MGDADPFPAVHGYATMKADRDRLRLAAKANAEALRMAYAEIAELKARLSSFDDRQPHD